MPSERFTFPGATGADLAARLDLPAEAPVATALLAHCFTCGKDTIATRRISARLTAAGFAVLRFDFTGLGQSGGAFETTTFRSNVEDLEAAAQALADRGLAPDLLIGHSLGGAAVLRAAGRIASVRAVVTIGAPFDPGHVTHNFEDAIEVIERDGAGDVLLGGRPVRIGRDFLRDVSATRLEADIAALKPALLVLHAPRDETVSIDNAAEIFTRAKHPKSFITLDDADHLLTRPEDADYAATVIGAWAARYLDLPPPPLPKSTPEGVVRVSEADPDGFLQDIQSGAAHHALADEPLAFGGTNRGMSPYGFVAAGLGACTSMTLRMYARQKGWPLTHVSVDVTHDKQHAADAQAGAAAGAKVDVFTRKIRLEGDLDDSQRARLLEIADKCPVHRTLEQGARVETSLT